MKINVITNNRGGPFNWGKNLVASLNMRKVDAIHTYDLKDILLDHIRMKSDIVHVAVPVAYKLWKNPLILTVHGEYEKDGWIWQPFWRRTVREADVVTVSSQFLRERLDLEDVIVIPNAVNPERFKPVLYTEKDKVNLVTITNFNYLKKAEGVLEIIEILKGLGNTPKEIEYHIIGTGNYFKKIKQQVTGEENLKIIFTGFLEDPRRILEKSDVFLYYSTHDEFPIVILEAMASGLPVITNDVGAVSEIIKNERDGFIVRDKDKYAEHLTSLMSNHQKRGSIGRNARKTVEERFDWNSIAERYIQIYESFKSK